MPMPIYKGTVQRLTGVRIFDLHVLDAVNLQHPSYFDSTNEYDMLVFRKLAYGDVKPLEEKARPANQRRMLLEIVTRPITFFLFDRLLVTVQQGTSKTLDQVRQRIIDPEMRGEGLAFDRSRLPKSPGELMLRILNGLVDRYLELRESLSDRLDRWQRDLLDPDRPFTNWSGLLEARIELRRLENLCEGQYDALTELRDAYLEETEDAGLNDAYLVRLNDVLEHIHRVLHHARRLEASAGEFSRAAPRDSLHAGRLVAILGDDTALVGSVDEPRAVDAPGPPPSAPCVQSNSAAREN